MGEKKQSINRENARAAFLATLPVLTGYLVLGIGFGIVLKTKGYGVLWALAMSVAVYAGSMQYLAVDLIAGGASLLTIGITTLMVNARHLFYGISMVERYQNAGREKPYLIFALTDETYSLVCKPELPEGTDPRRYDLLVSLFDQCYWVTGCVLGSLIGGLITFDVTGIDFALTALFLTVFLDQWRAVKDHVPAMVGVAASVGCLLLFGPDRFLIPAMLVITAALTLFRRPEKEGKAHA